MLLFELINILLKNPIAFIIVFSMLVIPLLMSITVHEWAHGFAAYKFGDPTPKNQGRLSLNPFRHIDPMGALMLFIIGIGWAKPVEINPSYFKNKFQFMMVAFAGPLSNFIMAILFSFGMYLAAIFFQIKGLNITEIPLATSFAIIFIKLLQKIVLVNLMLGIFNLLPIPPLDGSNILRSILPDNLAAIYFRIAPWGFFILVMLLFSGGIDYIVNTAYFLQSYIMEFILKIMPIPLQ